MFRWSKDTLSLLYLPIKFLLQPCSFDAVAKKYRLVESKYRKANDFPEVKFDLKSDLPSKLPPYIQDVISEWVSFPNY